MRARMLIFDETRRDVHGLRNERDVEKTSEFFAFLPIVQAFIVFFYFIVEKTNFLVPKLPPRRKRALRTLTSVNITSFSPLSFFFLLLFRFIIIIFTGFSLYFSFVHHSREEEVGKNVNLKTSQFNLKLRK